MAGLAGPADQLGIVVIDLAVGDGKAPDDLVVDKAQGLGGRGGHGVKVGPSEGGDLCRPGIVGRAAHRQEPAQPVADLGKKVALERVLYVLHLLDQGDKLLLVAARHRVPRPLLEGHEERAVDDGRLPQEPHRPAAGAPVLPGRERHGEQRHGPPHVQAGRGVPHQERKAQVAGLLAGLLLYAAQVPGQGLEAAPKPVGVVAPCRAAEYRVLRPGLPRGQRGPDRPWRHPGRRPGRHMLERGKVAAVSRVDSAQQDGPVSGRDRQQPVLVVPVDAGKGGGSGVVARPGAAFFPGTLRHGICAQAAR